MKGLQLVSSIQRSINLKVVTDHKDNLDSKVSDILCIRLLLDFLSDYQIYCRPLWDADSIINSSFKSSKSLQNDLIYYGEGCLDVLSVSDILSLYQWSLYIQDQYSKGCSQRIFSARWYLWDSFMKLAISLKLA